ncbi:MAG: hypothetical protein JSS02_14585 [Planctomycetes bacterium]|nr:hypothetical protein [Planctomycetota bacterium]
MRRLIAMLIGIAIGGGLVFASFNFHLVRTDKSWLLVRKKQADWHDAYVDIRGWSSREWGEHKALSDNLVAMGRGDLVQRSLADKLFRGFLDSFREAPAPPRHANPPAP